VIGFDRALVRADELVGKRRIGRHKIRAYRASREWQDEPYYGRQPRSRQFVSPGSENMHQALDRQSGPRTHRHSLPPSAFPRFSRTVKPSHTPNPDCRNYSTYRNVVIPKRFIAV